MSVQVWNKTNPQHRQIYGYILLRITLCNCPKIHMFEVEFKLDGMVVVPTHKNCGFALDAKQADKFQKDLVKSWGLEEQE